MSRDVPRPRPRIETLTDLIFGLALSIGAVGLLNNRPPDTQDFLYGVFFFGFSFFILIGIWLRYTDTMSILPVETSGTRSLNIALLFLVALEPYLFNLVAQTNSFSGDVASAAFAADLGGVFAILALFNNVLASKKRGLVGPDKISNYRLLRDLELVATAFFWISILPQFYTIVAIEGSIKIYVRYFVWVPTLFLPQLKRLKRGPTGQERAVAS
jgi:uncharacterized membrane protein